MTPAEFSNYLPASNTYQNIVNSTAVQMLRTVLTWVQSSGRTVKPISRLNTDNNGQPVDPVVTTSTTGKSFRKFPENS